MIYAAIAILAFLIASYTDLKSREAPETLTTGLILGGLFLHGWESIIISSFSPIISSAYMAALAFFFSFFLYKIGAWAGGDVKLFTALTLLLPFYPNSIRPFIASMGITPITSNYPFIVSVFILSGIFFMLVIPLFYLKKIFAKQAKIPEFKKKLAFGLVYCVILSPILYLWFGMSRYVTILFVPMFFALLIIPFKDDIVVLFFARKKRVANLNDDDVMALESMNKTTITKLGLWRKTFTPPEIKKIKERAKKYRIATVMVCENLPKYVPYIFISLILNLLAGDVFLHLFSLG